MQDYNCRLHLRSLFFNDGFNAISYAYSQNKTQLMRFIADHLSLVSLDSPDYLNIFVFNQFFNHEIFSVALQSFVNRNYQVTENQISTLTLVFQQLFLKQSMSKKEDDQKSFDELTKAIQETKCEIYNQILRVYYYLTFTVNGKLQFDPVYATLMKNSGAQFIERFAQLMGDNLFIYGGPDEDPRIKKPKEGEQQT